ncbi:MAG TPA: glutaredoxin family protein [Candidatus Saccharimonadales bacterium]|jgi:glutaredoxin
MKPTPSVTIYSTSTCAICHAEMEWLDKQAITYRTVIVDEQDNGIAELMTVSGGAIGVPYTVIERGDDIVKVSGFDRSRLSAALA